MTPPFANGAVSVRADMSEPITSQPMMTPEQVKLVQDSFRLIHPNLERFAEVFYMHLFEQCPEIQYMYRGGQTEQEQKLTRMLVAIVEALDRADGIKPTLWSLGRRHVTYGVRAKHYQAFGEALTWTVEKFLDTAYTPGVQDAWRGFYDYISGIMQGRVDYHVTLEPTFPKA